MDLQDVRGLNNRKWGRSLLRLSWVAILIVAIAELIIFLLKRRSGTVPDVWDYLLRYLFLPAARNALILGVVSAVSVGLMARGRFALQAFIYLTGAAAIAMNVAWVHRVVFVAHAAFLVPIMLALIFLDKRAQWYAFLLSTGLYTVFALWYVSVEPVAAPDFMEICTTYAMLAIAQLTALLVTDRQLALVQGIIEVNRLSMLDSMTKLLNHAAFYQHLDAHILRQVRGDLRFCLIIFDIDNFKLINDQCGHDVGDEVLLALVSALKDSIDADEEAFRYGGEEFTVLTPRGTEQSYQLAETIRTAFAENVAALSCAMEATVSAGICQYDPAVSRGRREFFASADEALYEAKRTGKNRTVIWDASLLARSRDAKEHPPQ